MARLLSLHRIGFVLSSSSTRISKSILYDADKMSFAYTPAAFLGPSGALAQTGVSLALFG